DLVNGWRILVLALGEGGAGCFAPGPSAIVGDVKLHPEMAQLKRSVNPTAMRILDRKGNRIAQQGLALDRPVGPLTLQRQQPLARGSQQRIAHDYPHEKLSA